MDFSSFVVDFSISLRIPTGYFLRLLLCLTNISKRATYLIFYAHKMLAIGT